MVLPILFLSAGLILTFGGTIMRLLDRLKISFKLSVVLQLSLLAAVIAPHVTVSFQSYLAAAAYLTVFLIGLVYLAYVRRLRAPWWFLAGLLVNTAMSLVIQILLADSGLGNGWIALLVGVWGGGVAFLFSASHPAAFLSAALSQSLAFALIFFTPLFDMLRLTAVLWAVRYVNCTVYALFIGLALMNLLKRMRGNYAESKARPARVNRGRAGD